VTVATVHLRRHKCTELPAFLPDTVYASAHTMPRQYAALDFHVFTRDAGYRRKHTSP